MGEEVEGGIGELLAVDAEALQEILAERPLVERELDVEGGGEPGLEFLEDRVGEALGAEGGMVDRRRFAERAVADGVNFHLGDLAIAIAERAERLRHGAVDNLEVAAAGEFLELDQREIRLDAGGVAIHDQADRA